MNGPRAGYVTARSTRRPVRETIPVEIEWCPDGLPAMDFARSSHLSYQHEVIAAALRSRPGLWARLRSLPLSYKNAIATGSNTAYRPGGSFEAAIRNGELCARYIG